MVNFLYLSIGAVLGATLRWGLGTLFNASFASLALGTLLANYIGCFLMGGVMALIAHIPQLPAEWRVLLITGFLGSLTTFSAFSGEVVENLLQGKCLQGLGIALLHMVGCLVCTFVGFWLARGFHVL